MARNSSTAATSVRPQHEHGDRTREPAAITAPDATSINDTAARMRACRSAANPEDTARALTRTLAAWRDREFGPRRTTVAAIAAAWGYSEPLLEASFDALLQPFTEAALTSFAASSRLPQPRDSQSIAGMIMPGNLPGAGIHEVLIALLSGAAVILKTSAAEPIFFASFARTLRQFDGRIGERMAVFNWGRDRRDLTAALRANCDWLAAFGDDDTIARLAAADDDCDTATGMAAGREASSLLRARFGLRFSGAYVSIGAAAGPDRVTIAQALACDLSLFEQAGCLSPHHIFVESAPDLAERFTAHARDFAAELAKALDRLACVIPPPRRLGLEAAAALRRARETARWRGLGGEPLELWEGQGLGWTVIYDQNAQFTPSPGFRTVTVSPVTTPADLAHRLKPVAGRLEAFAVAGASANLDGVRQCLVERGASYLCAPGAMQSPPLQWRHGGGAFLDALSNQ